MQKPEDLIRQRLGGRSIVLVGLMGAGKSTLGRRLASRLSLPFKDADQEIQEAANMTIADIFAVHGEPYSRSDKQRVIARLLAEGPLVLATGGGAFMNADTRAHIKEAGLSVWLRADLDVLMRRARRRANRPLLRNADPEGTMRELMTTRHPVYALADLTVESRETLHEGVTAELIAALAARLADEA